MMAIHTESATIFGGMNVNEAELKIQYIKYRPSLPYDSKSPITFTIPGNTTPYVLLRDSYLFVQCHVEETEEYGNPPTTDPTHAKRSLHYEGEEEATPPSKTIKRTPLLMKRICSWVGERMDRVPIGASQKKNKAELDR